MQKLWLAVLAIAGVCVAAGAQQRDYAPTCAMCPGTFIGEAEIDQYLKRAIANKLTDQQVRAVDMGKSNVGIGVVYRAKQATAEAVAEHDLVSEVYHIIQGRATLMLGPDLIGKERRPASQKTVRVQNGPGNGAKAIRNGVSYDLGPGDVVVIPAGTGHQFTKIDEDISYLMVRFDPDKVVPVKSEADSKTDLLGSGIETPEEARAAGARNLHLEKEQAPSCDVSGYYLPRSEVEAYTKRAIANQLTDQQMRAVDIGRINVGIGVVYRGRLDNPEAAVAEHDLVGEIYHIIDGGATLTLGPDLIGKVRRPATLTTVRLLNGPGNGATGIRGGVSYELAPGDVVTIPAGPAIKFTKIPDHISYLMVRIDPGDKVLPLKSESDSKADLRTDGRTTAGGGAGAANGVPPR